MIDRRRILKYFLIGVGAALSPLSVQMARHQPVWALSGRRVVEKKTPMSKLMHANPARLDTSNLETTPMEKFDVMGETTLQIDLEEWRLEVDGDVREPYRFRLAELMDRPRLERNVLLICPGFFAYNGWWTGFSVADLLREAGCSGTATHVLFTGSQGFRKKKMRYGIDEVRNDKVFAAYRVNNQELPRRHGFPLRLVADDHKGTRWLKYLNRITVETR